MELKTRIPKLEDGRRRRRIIMKDQKSEPNDDPKELTDEEWEIIWIDEDEFNLDTD
jgi:hypothetical protein